MQGMETDNMLWQDNAGKGMGHVFLVGAGPGRRDLITVQGLELLRGCDVVVYDRLSGEELLGEVKDGCEQIDVGKGAGHGARQDEINELLVRKAKEGLQVVRLKGGDPFVFGRGGEEAEYLLAARVPFTVVPGVSSAVAVPELAGIPVTHRNMSRSFHVITGHTTDRTREGREAYLRSQIAGLRDTEGTLVFLMGLSSLERICSLLMEYGRPPSLPAAIIGNGHRYNECLVRGTLSDIGEKVRREGLVSPAVILVGETAGLSLRCESSLPLSGVRIGMVGTGKLTRKLGSLLRGTGAETLWVQGVFTHSRAGAIRLEEVSACTWIVFTSAVGVDVFFRQWSDERRDMRTLSGIRMAVIGSGTAAALEARGIYPDFMPQVYTAEDLAKGLVEQLDQGRDRVILWQAREGNPVLEETLKKADISVVRVEAYETKAGPCRPMKEVTTLSYLTFASSFGVAAFCRENPHMFETETFKHISVFAIGTRTAEALARAGCRHCQVARTFTAEGLAEAILEDYTGRKDGRI